MINLSILVDPSSRALRAPFVAFLAVVVVIASVAVPASPALAAQSNGYYSVPYSNTLYYHYSYGNSSGTNPATYDDWVKAGRPAPMQISTDFVKYPWSPTVYAVSYFDGGWVWSGPLAFEQWQKAGSPKPRDAGFISGTTYFRWSTSSELFAQALDNSVHKLSYGEWAASGFQDSSYQTDAGYQKLSWAQSIAKMYSISTGGGYAVTYGEWTAVGNPTPQIVSRMAGDEFCVYPGNPSIFYSGQSASGWINYSQWAAAGFPAPTAC